MKLLAHVECLAEYAEQISNDPKCLISDAFLSQNFVEADLSIIKERFISVAVPPPEHKDAQDIIVMNPNKDFVCLDITKDGSVCGKVFRDFKALQLHRINGTLSGGEHGCLTVASLVITNVCP
jgi:hypothetical protein